MRPTRLVVVAFSLVFLIISCGSIVEDAPVSKATVSGRALDSDGNPVAGALITITSTPVTTNTDVDGYFSAEVGVGDHTLTISVGNYTVCRFNFQVDDESPVDFGNLDPSAPYFSNGEIWYKDSDGDLYSDGTSVDSDIPPVGYDLATNLTDTSGDCNDNVASIHPGVTDVCNSLDDNCDGSIDEDFTTLGNACSVGTGECVSSGNYICRGDGSDVICFATPGSPVVEICDGLDNDCDGVADEDFVTLGESCTAGVGECADIGNYICRGDGSDVICFATPGSPVAEICDGLDNDCDGVVDDGNPEGGVSCDTGIPGLCAAGTTLCQGGTLVCEQDIPAVTELCDGLDNDCDGVTDEGNPGGGSACSTDELGVCSAGTLICQDSSLGCVQDVSSSSELCDGLDNDCDGLADEDFVTLGESCTESEGECTATGSYVCSGDGSGVTCDAVDSGCGDVVVYGDSRSGHSMHQVIMGGIAAIDPVAVFHTGDLVSDGRVAADWSPSITSLPNYRPGLPYTRPSETTNTIRHCISTTSHFPETRGGTQLTT